MGKFHDALKKWQQESGSPKAEPAARLEPAAETPATAPAAEPRQVLPPEEPRAAQIEPLVVSPPEPIAAGPVPLEQPGSPPQAPSPFHHLLLNSGADQAVAEQYRMLRTQVLHRHNGNPPRTILVTSALQGEGKSTVAANLAISIAQSVREHVLLIDCDLREPSLHRLFGLRPAMGLADHLRRGVPLAQLLQNTGVDKLSFLPAGPKAGDASELLASQRMKSLLAEVRARYDDRFIVLDSTPLLPTTDPTILAGQVEAILLVVRAGLANRELVARVIEAVGREKIMGVVFNGAQPSPMSYTYKYYSSAGTYGRA